MRKLLLASILFFATMASAAVKCAYPCVTDYNGRGLIVTNTGVADSLRLKFLRWKSQHYMEQGTLARIKFDAPNDNFTVSEGIGYGMLLMVYFSDNTTSHQPEFDKLWAYYKNFSTNGLMNWKVDGFSSVNQSGAATDAEMDVAAALVLAYNQFGQQSYLDDAKTLIAAIKSQELDANNRLKPGSNWDTDKNPSYVSPAAFNLFGVATNDVATWNSVKTANYSLLSANQQATTGLWSDWCNVGGTPTAGPSPKSFGSDIFYFDAVRTPWRMAWAYKWNGDTQAKTMTDKMATWLMTKTNNTPIGIQAGSNRSTGAWLETYKASAMTGGYLSAVSTGTSVAYQNYLNSGFNGMMRLGLAPNYEKYFSATLQLLYGLLLAGLFPDLTLANPSHPPVSSSVVSSSSTAVSSSATSSTITSSTTVSSSVATSSTTVSSTTASSSSAASPTGDPVGGFTTWGTYVDDFGTSTVVPDPASSPVVKENGVNVAKATMLKAPNVSPYPYVGLMLALDPEGLDVDLSAVTAIQLTYKSAGTVRMGLMQVDVSGGGAEYGIELAPTTSYVVQTINVPADLAQPLWAASASWERPLNMAHTMAIKWELIHGALDDAASSVSGSISIKDIQFVGWAPAANAPMLQRRLAGLALHACAGSLLFSVPRDGLGKVEVLDLMGKHVATPVSGMLHTGDHAVALRMPTRGIYLVRLTQGSAQVVTRVVVR